MVIRYLKHTVQFVSAITIGVYLALATTPDTNGHTEATTAEPRITENIATSQLKKAFPHTEVSVETQEALSTEDELLTKGAVPPLNNVARDRSSDEPSADINHEKLPGEELKAQLATQDAQKLLWQRQASHTWSELDESQLQFYLTTIGAEDHERLLTQRRTIIHENPEI